MEKNIYIVRHCEAQGQSSNASLTARGFIQAEYLASFFSELKIDQIISSPFLRATQTIEPLSKMTNIKIKTDERLSERILSTADLPDWFEKLRQSFQNLDLKFEGGESSKEAMNRAIDVVVEITNNKLKNTIIVTHGNLMALLLRKYDPDFDFECWNHLSNPDVFRLSVINDNVCLQRVWTEK